MSDLHVTLVTDGSSDRVLLRHLRWLLELHLSSEIAIQLQWADLGRLRQRPNGLREKVQYAIAWYPCDLLFVHRDAEAPDPSPRYAEMGRILGELREPSPAVCVVPVRMTEAWLLFDEQALRIAAGNPNGRDPVSLPSPVAAAERLADPKRTLHEAILTASGLRGRRRKKFAMADALHHLASNITDFSALRQLTAFKRLEDDLASVIGESGWGKDAATQRSR